MERTGSIRASAPGNKPGVASPASAAMRVLQSFYHLWRRQKIILLAGLLFGLVVWVFWPSLHCKFLFWDDCADITDEAHVKSGLLWRNVTWAFFTLEHCNWYPLNWLSHMLDCQVYGLEPWGHHLTSILIHALNAVLVFVVFRKMTGAVWRSLAMALLFGLHPLRVQSVTWICERKDVLSCFFWLLTLLAYTQYAHEHNKNNGRIIRFYSLALLFFVLGLMSKAMLVTLPFVLLLLDYWPLELYLRKSWSQLAVEKLPFIGLAFADSWITLKAQQGGGLTDEMKDLPMSDKIGNALISCVRYLGKFFWPENLSIYYPHPGHWPLFQMVGAGLFVFGVSTAVILLRRRMPFLLVGWFWYLGTLVPVLGLVQLLSQSMADRYTYIPLIGFTLLLVWWVENLTRRWRYKSAMMLVLGTSIIIAGAIKTRHEIGFYKDDVTLWRHAVAVTENEYNWCPHYSLGSIFFITRHFADAVKEFQESVRINPNYAQSRLSLGATLGDLGRFDEAIVQYQKVLELKPGWSLAWFNYGIALLNKDEWDNAINPLHHAVECEPGNARYREVLALVLTSEQQNVEALSKLREAAKQNPARADFLNDLAWFLATTPYSRLRNGAEAVQLAERACQLTHYQSAAAINTLAAAYAEAGHFEEAITNAQLASSMALKSGDEALLHKSERMLNLFQLHRPYHETVKR
jgi:tetratricopeptide (TPR) repeat protein